VFLIFDVAVQSHMGIARMTRSTQWRRRARHSALAIIAGASFGSVPAHADAYCIGLVNETLTYADGRMMIYSAWRNDWTTLCSLNGAWNGISSQTCFAWFSQVQAAVAARRNLGIWYGGLTQAQCATMGTYDTSPAPVYVRSMP
jgi:hypothetical protein